MITTQNHAAAELVQRLRANFPPELIARPQWLLAAPDKKGALKVPKTLNAYDRIVDGASNDPSTWMDFDAAADAAIEHGFGLGYVLHADDPFTCVDFDVKNAQNEDDPVKWTSAESIARMKLLVDDLNSYTELSGSRQGVHVWVRAEFTGEGMKRAGVEVYCTGRFMACTGLVVNRLPVADRQEEINLILANMRAAEAQTRAAELDVNEEQELTDEEVMRRATIAENSSKFKELWEGRWEQYGYPSQSEADLSLMSMLTYYSSNDEQCRRLFRHSKLGEREKALKNDKYLNFTLRLIRGRQAKEALREEQVRAAAETMLAGLRNGAREHIARLQGPPVAPALGPLPPPAAPVPLPGPGEPAGAPPAPPAGPVLPESNGLPWPPGAAGAIARFIYSSAPRPVPEVAVVATLGWLAGVCGKAWTIPGSGLNVYIILVARSAIGKEAMHSGIGALVARIREGVPSADGFVDFNDFASGPALAKACAQKSSFVNVAGEFGHKLRRMAHSESGNGEGPMRQLRTVMTNLYQKSGPASIVGGITYSSKDNNVASVSGVAFSMIGETTPNTLYESLTEGMMEDGFLSRFTIVEYTGQRPPANHNPARFPDGALAAHCQALCLQATTLINNHQRCDVRRTLEAGQLMDAFDIECDQHINASLDESWRQMWNRAHLKMCRIAALLAVADDPHAPCITQTHAEWALMLIRRDITTMKRKLEEGDIGVNDASREKKLLSVIQDFLTQPVPDSYGIPAGMVKDGIVPRKYLQVRTRTVSSFNQHRLGATAALDLALKSLTDSGYIVEADKGKVLAEYAFAGKSFRVLQLR